MGHRLCSTLVTYIARSPAHWEQPLLQLALSFYNGTVVSTAELKRSDITVPALLPSLSPSQLMFLLWFTGSLAHEFKNKRADTPELARIHYEMEIVIKDAGALMSWLFTQPVGKGGSKVRAEALQTFSICIDYAQPTINRNPEYLQYLRDLIDQAADCLLDHELQLDALAIFRDILDSYSVFFQSEHMQMLAQITFEHLSPKLLQGLADQGSDEVEIGKFVTAYGCANIQRVIEEPSDQLQSIAIVQLLCEILASSGYPGVEDQISIHTIEFWNTYIEYVNDFQGSQDAEDADPKWLNNSKQVMLRVVELLWRKMWTPPKEVAELWDNDESNDFNAFRSDAEDPLLSTFVLCGRDILQLLASATLQSLQANEWHGVEASLFCLNKLADNVLEDLSMEDALITIFRSTLFTDIADFTRPIPSQTRRTAIEMLGAYGQYIERHPEFLPDTLRFLFAALEMAGLAPVAARSISSLCSACRTYLTGELAGFLNQYNRFVQSKTCDQWTKQKVIGAIASIVQALKPESAKVPPLIALLTLVEQDAREAKRWADEGDMEMAEMMGVTSLESLATIGKAMQVPDDVPIDIYDDDEQPAAKSSFWQSEEGQSVQLRIVRCFSVLSVVGTYREAIEAACQVLKSGFAETEPGPFVLPASVTVDFLQQCSITTPAVEMVLSTAAILITQHSRNDSSRIDQEIRSIYNSVTGFLRALGQPSNDSGIAYACIELLTRLMPCYTHILFEGLDSFTLDFTLSAIDGMDPIPKRAACDFWTKIIEPQTAPIQPEVQQRINQMFDAYGPKLCMALVHQIAGVIARSDFDTPCKPIKALLLHQKGTQAWLQQALVDPSFPSTRVTMERRAQFLRMVSSTRSDGRKLKDIIRTFWAECMGTVASYSS